MKQNIDKHAKSGWNKPKKSLLLLAFFLIGLIVMSACGAAAPEAPAAEQPEEPAAPQEPTEPIEPEEQFPVQYGQDTRMELFEHPDSQLKEMAGSVAVFVNKSQLHISDSEVALDGYTLNEMGEMGWLISNSHLPMCADELFASQPAPGFCTGFLISEDILVTAGHCLQKTSCADTNIVFGFQMESDKTLAKISKNDVFECAGVLAKVIPNSENHYLDYAIIKLDRPTGRTGLDFTADDQLGAQDSVAVMGYPSGLPQKIASNAFVMSNEIGTPFFIANLDTFGSNSGSPVINMETYQVEGILVRGTTDYVLSQDASCIEVNRCPEGGSANCAGENATKMSMLAERLSESLNDQSDGSNCYPGLLLPLTLLALMRLKFTSQE